MRLSYFDRALTVPEQDFEFEFRGARSVPWADFLLNPRRLRGSDFLMRWSQGVWSERRLVHAVNQTGKFVAVPYGPSGTAPTGDPRDFELYFERLELASTDGMKRPDLLVLRKRDESEAEELVSRLGGPGELPFTHEDDPLMQTLLQMAVVAVECENSLWRARLMPGYGSSLSPQRRLGGKLGLKKSVVCPTVIIKEEDRGRLREWQARRGVPIHVWHVFYDLAFGIAFDVAENLIGDGLIGPTQQVFQAPGGATTRKDIYKIYYHYAYPLGESGEDPMLVADHIVDKNGHILPYVRFEGGNLVLSAQAAGVLEKLAHSKEA